MSDQVDLLYLTNSDKLNIDRQRNIIETHLSMDRPKSSNDRILLGQQYRTKTLYKLCPERLLGQRSSRKSTI